MYTSKHQKCFLCGFKKFHLVIFLHFQIWLECRIPCFKFGCNVVLHLFLNVASLTTEVDRLSRTWQLLFHIPNSKWGYDSHFSPKLFFRVSSYGL